MSELDSASRRYFLKMKYQKNQFLRAGDFQDEQEYHIEKIKHHNRTLHTWGVCGDGLKVTPSTRANFCVDVSKGSAIDADGNPILLADTEEVDLSGFHPGTGELILTISYGESDSGDKQHKQDEGGFRGVTRTLEKPVFIAWPKDSPSADPNFLVLAVIKRDNNGKIASCDCDPVRTGRLTAGVKHDLVLNANIADKAVTTSKIKDGAVTAKKIARHTITSYQLKNGAVNTGAIQTAAVTSDKLEKLDTAANKKGAVATENIQDAAVTSDKIRANSVTSRELESVANVFNRLGAVATANIQNGAVTSTKLEKVDEAANKKGAVAKENIQDGAVTAEKIKDGSLPLNKLVFYKSNPYSFSITRGKDDASSKREISMIIRSVDYMSKYPHSFSVWVTSTEKGLSIPLVTWYEKVRPSDIKDPKNCIINIVAQVTDLAEGDIAYCKAVAFTVDV